MQNTVWIPIVKGICVAVFITAMGVENWSLRWWAAMLAMNVMINI